VFRPDGSLGLLIPIGLLLLVIVLAVRERARQALLERWASSNGWSSRSRRLDPSLPTVTVDWIDRLPGRSPWGVSLLLSGTLSGRAVSVAEYANRETGGGDGTTLEMHRFIVVVVNLHTPLPDMEVRPRARRRFGRGTQSAETFDQRFRVLGDAVATEQVIPPALLAEHVAGTVPPWSVHHTELMTYTRGRLRDPERIPDFVAPLLRVADHLDPRGDVS
jgi:hypothetical protein